MKCERSYTFKQCSLRICAVALSVAFVFSGCAQQDTEPSAQDNVSSVSDSVSSADVSSVSDTVSSVGDISEPDSSDEATYGFGWYNSMAILKYDENNEPVLLTSYDLCEQSEDIKLLLKPNVEPDPSLGLTEVDCELFFVCEGNIVPHCVDGGEPVEISTHKLKSYRDNKLDITIPKLVTKNGGLTTVNAVLNACPSFVPQNGFQETATTSAFPFFAMAEKGDVKDDVYIAQDGDYIDKSSGQRTDDIGYTPEHAKELGEYGIHMYHPVVIDDSVDGLYLTLSIDNPHKYLAAVFCDGKLMDIFGGKHFISVKTDEKTLCYRIDKSLLPKSGMHTYEILPLCDPDLSDFDISVFDSTSIDYSAPELFSEFQPVRLNCGKYRVEIK